MGSVTVLLIAAVAVTASALTVPLPPPGSPDVPEECRPKPPEPGKESPTCCELPRPVSPDNEKFKETFSECRKQVMADHPEIVPPGPPHHHGPPPPPSGSPPPPPSGSPPPPPSGSPPHPPHGGPPHQHNMFFNCMDECFFNKTGFLTAEMKLNEEAIKKTLSEVLEADSIWKPVVDEAIKTCVNASNTSEKDVQEEEEVCDVAPHKFIKCLMRHMYLGCPSGVWQDNEECKAEKQLVEKCPNLPRPHPPHPPHPPKKID